MSFKYGVVNESIKCYYGQRNRIPSISGPRESELFGNQSISLVAGRRDWAAFQVVVSGEEQFTLSAGTRPAFSPLGPLDNIRVDVRMENCENINIKMNLVGYVDDDNGIYKTDILLEDDVITVERKKVQPVWVELTVPEEAIPGTYKGYVDIYKQRMFEDEEKMQRLFFEITVKDFVMKEPKNFSFHLDLWQHLSNIARKHEVQLWSEEHFVVIENYVKTLGDLGQKAITVVASEIPWSGQGCFYVDNYPSDLFEYNMVKIYKKEQGNFVYDFSVIERYVELCFRYGIDKEIEVFGLLDIWIAEDEGYGKVAKDYPNGIRIRYLDCSDGCYKYMRNAEEIKNYCKAVLQFFRDKNWVEQVRITADEPANMEIYTATLKVIQEIAPEFKLKAAINRMDFIDELKDKVDDFIPKLPIVCERWEDLQEIKKKIKGRLNWYVCGNPLYPNTLIQSPLLESRLIGILNAYLGLDGFLRWNYTAWPEYPRTRISYKAPNWPAGDTNFVYPAANGKPLLSLRYKNFKRGIEEYELIEKIKKSSLEAEKILEKVWALLIKNKDIRAFYKGVQNPKELYSLSYKEYEEARRMLLDEICKL